jgi:starch synthase
MIEPARRPLRIAFISSEAVPFYKTGGLADVAGALPRALAKMGHDVRVFVPQYKAQPKMTDPGSMGLIDRVTYLNIKIGDRLTQVNVSEVAPKGYGFKYNFLEHPGYFGNRDGLYGLDGKDHPDNFERFTLFSMAALDFYKAIGWKPDIIHAHDWQAAMSIAYLIDRMGSDPFFHDTAGIYTIHNLAYMGQFSKDKMPATGLGWGHYNMNGLEFYGDIIFKKGGVNYSHAITTVSSGYAQEIKDDRFQYGCGLTGLMQSHSGKLTGIVNGIDHEEWDPARDEKIYQKFDASTIGNKMKNKTALQAEKGLKVDEKAPLIGIVARLSEQKGFEIFARALDSVMEMNPDCQFIILGDGPKNYIDLLQEAIKKYPGRISLTTGFDEALSHKIYASSDMFLMPSKYEPCGLGQLISMRYGTVPIVRNTGGLKDTVTDHDGAKGDGFVFGGQFDFNDASNARSLIKTFGRAFELYSRPDDWQALQKQVMGKDLSWNKSAKEYETLYLNVLGKMSVSLVEPDYDHQPMVEGTPEMALKNGMFCVTGGKATIEISSKKKIEMEFTPFAIAESEVTNKEFAEFLKETGYEFSCSPEELLKDASASVGYLSKQDAIEYAAWRSKKAGRQYRLPSKSELILTAQNLKAELKYDTEYIAPPSDGDDEFFVTAWGDLPRIRTWTLEDAKLQYLREALVGECHYNSPNILNIDKREYPDGEAQRTFPPNGRSEKMGLRLAENIHITPEIMKLVDIERGIQYRELLLSELPDNYPND